jgi:GR25 family glycosyltransferase involved in LPS biosynthesis
LKFLNYQRFSAVDGKKLVSTCQLQQIFENNDYQMRRGMVGCFMSHVKLYCDLIYDNDAEAYLILEDDIECTDDFETKYNALVDRLYKDDSDWSFCFLGHHIRDLDLKDTFYDRNKSPPTIEKINVYKSFILSLGGTTGYLISKTGAKDFLDFLDSTGATNGIDTCIQKAANNLNIYYPTPHLIFSDCWRGDNQKVDSDIQFDYSNLEKSVEERIVDEVKFYQEKDQIIIHVYEFDNIMKYITKKEITYPSYYKDEDESRIKQIQDLTIHPYYMIGKSCIFIVPKKIERYFHRYKINDKYSVDDAIVYS